MPEDLILSLPSPHLVPPFLNQLECGDVSKLEHSHGKFYRFKGPNGNHALKEVVV